MNYVERAIEKSLTHIIIAGASDPGTLGMQRENAVLAILGAFRVSSKSVLQRHLGLSREAVNKLVNRMKKKQLITLHSSFANTDKGFILLTSQGIREAEFLLNRELQLRSDASRINERNLIHDLSVQIVILDLAKRQKITGFASEKDLAILLENRGNDPRLVDGLAVDADTGCIVAIEMETSNAKNKGNGKLRESILNKYLQELEDTNGLYEFVYMYSHRQRFLTQIEKAHSKLFSANRSQFSREQQTLLASRIKFKAQECNVIYELMFNSKRQLGDDKLELVRKDSYLQQLEELEKLARTTGDRVIQIRRDGFIEAGKLMGLIE